MKRRNFIKKAGVATAGAFAMPYILPSGKLFASTGGGGIADHVVFVLFAGGVRQQESVLKRYLDDSQGVPIPGNIMYNLMDGAPPDSKRVYGTDGDLPGDTPIPKILTDTLQSQGVLFPEMRADHPGHYAGLNAMLTGTYNYTLGLKQKPTTPTIFEFARKHLGLPASKVWFIGNGIGNSIPLLNYSTDENYGSEFGANFLAPSVTFGASGFEHLSNSKIYHPEEELGPVYKMKFFLDQVALTEGKGIPGIKNSDAEKHELKDFMRDMFNKTASGTIAHPPVNDNGDLRTIGYACEVMKKFTPAITVVNLSNVDGCHGNFTGYLKSLHRADHGVAHLWNYIQSSIPSMSGNTALILAPEMGRNLNPNPILDENDWASFDHSDANTKRVFGMMAGPGIDAGLPIGSEGSPVGEITEAMITAAEILGFKSDVLSSGVDFWTGGKSWFDHF